MKTKYIINNNEMIVNFDFIDDFNEDINNLESIRKDINNLIEKDNINFLGNKIIVYRNGLLIGTFYLTNYYLKKFNKYKLNNFLTPLNSYFYEISVTEIFPKKKKVKKNN